MAPVFRDLTPLERRTFRLHLASSALEGICGGLWLIHDFFAVRTLGAEPWQIWILVTLWPVTNLFSVYFTGFMEDRRRLPRLILAAGLLGRLPMVLMAFTSSIWPFLGLVGLFTTTFSLAKPAQNLILQANYGEGRRGRLFGWAWGVNMACAGGVSILAGLALDRDPQSYRWLLPLEGVAGLSAFILLAAIPIAPPAHAPTCQERRGLVSSFRESYAVLRRHPGFLLFERNFMVYGFAFMVVLPALPILADQELELDYTDVALARGILGQVITILVMPWFGALLDRTRPSRPSAVAFAILVLYAALVGLSPSLALPSPTFWFCLGFLFYGVGMGGLNLVWHMGSIYYAPPGQVALFQGIHVTLTGLRGLAAPLVGFLVLEFFGPRLPFALSALLFGAAAVLMFRLAKHEENHPTGGRF